MTPPPMPEQDACLRDLAEQADVPQACFDLDLRYVYINHAGAGILRRTVADCLGKTLREVGMPTAMVVEREAAMRLALAEGEAEVEFILYQDGERRAFQTRFRQRWDADGRVIGLLAWTRDVTKLNKASSALSSMERHFVQFADAVRDVMWITDLDHSRYYYLSPALTTVWGLAREELARNPDLLWEHIHPEDRERCREHLRQLPAGPVIIEFRIIRPDGRLRWIRARVFPHLESPGQPKVYGISEDITELKAAALALAESELRLRYFGDAMRDGLWIRMASQPQYQYLSSAMETIWGLPLEEIRQEPDALLALIHPDDRARCRSQMQDPEHGYAMEFRIVRRDHSQRWLRSRAFPWRDEHGNRLVYGITEDITERKELEQLREERRVAERELLTREIHHRIKNSLQGVAGMLQLYATDHPEVAVILDLAIARLYTVGLVYGLQGRTGRVPGLAEMVFAVSSQCMSLYGRQIALDIAPATPEMVLPAAEAQPLALVFNELLANALKHGERQSVIAVAMDGDIERGVRLEIRNRRRAELAECCCLSEEQGGVGLKLAYGLLPPEGVSLTVGCDDEHVVATLDFDPGWLSRPGVGDTR